MDEFGAPADASGRTILALDTTARAGSVALYRHGRIQEVWVGDATRSHGERLPGDIRALLDRAGARVGDVDLYAVVSGPGSFTGLRVGIAAIQGLAMATGRQVVAVPALEALAWSPALPEGRIGVWMDAQRQQVFAAMYDKTGDELNGVHAPVSLPPERVIEHWGTDEPALVLIGDGIDRYGECARTAWPLARLIVPAPPLAPIAAMLAARGAYPPIAPHAIVPIYVRASDAEIARARAGGQPGA